MHNIVKYRIENSSKGKIIFDYLMNNQVTCHYISKKLKINRGTVRKWIKWFIELEIAEYKKNVLGNKKIVCFKLKEDIENNNNLSLDTLIKYNKEKLKYPSFVPTGKIKLRFELLKKYNFTCQYCGRKAPEVILQIDHKNPKSKGGKLTEDNLTVACSECNLGKSDILL